METKKSRFRSLRQRLAVYLGIPMILQILLSGYLFYEFLKFEKLAVHQTVAKEIIGRVNWLHLLLVSNTLSWLQFQLSGDKQYQDFAAKDRHLVGAELVKLSGLLASQSQDQLSKELSSAVSAYEKLFLLFSTEPVQSAGVQKLEAIKQALFSEQAKSAADQFLVVRKKILASDRNQVVLDSSDLPEARRYIKFACLLLLFLSIAVFCIQVGCYSRYVEARLRVLEQNAIRVGQSEQLLPALEGGDEFATVDSALHRTTELLREAREREQILLQNKQELMDMVTHDLRTPLSSLLGVFELLQMEKIEQDSEKKTKLIAKGIQISRRMIQMAGDLLLLEKAQSGMLTIESAKCQLSCVFDELAELTGELAEKKNVKLVFNASDVEAVIDPDRILQVLTNLVSNAVKFSDPGTCVSITAGSVSGGIEIAVADQGRGIPEEQIEHVFDRYYQVRNSDSAVARGTGLGLSICKQIVELHGGFIDVHSRAGVGTTFVIFLPAR